MLDPTQSPIAASAPQFCMVALLWAHGGRVPWTQELVLCSHVDCRSKQWTPLHPWSSIKPRAFSHPLLFNFLPVLHERENFLPLLLISWHRWTCHARKVNDSVPVMDAGPASSDGAALWLSIPLFAAAQLWPAYPLRAASIWGLYGISALTPPGETLLKSLIQVSYYPVGDTEGPGSRTSSPVAHNQTSALWPGESTASSLSNHKEPSRESRHLNNTQYYHCSVQLI